MNSSLPSTAVLLALRRRLCAADAELPDAENTLRQLRSTFIGSSGALGSGGPDELLAAFRGVWRVLASLSPREELHVPPLYASPQLDRTLRNIVVRVCQRERGGFVTDSTTNIGHYVLGGVEGAGKTTLLRAVVLGVAVLLQRMLPITHTFTASNPAYSIVRLLSDARALACEKGRRCDSTEATASEHFSDEGLVRALQSLQECGHDVVLALDEFQFVFNRHSPVLAQLVQIASQVREVSRMGATYGLLAGSSADMRQLVFRSGSAVDPDPWRVAGFPDFNASLYSVCEVQALRDVDSLKRFISTRYPEWHVTDADAAELLYWTGGIGRVLQEARIDCGTVLGVEVRGVSAAVKALRDAPQERRLSPENAFDDPVARLVVTAIVMRNASAVAADATRDRHTLPCIGIQRFTLLQSLRLIGVADAASHINRLADLSLLYATTDVVQLARPCDAHVYYYAGVPQQRNVLLLTAVRMMVEGIVLTDSSGAGVEDVSHVNAGNALEFLVRGGVGRLMPTVADAAPVFSGWRVRVHEGKLQLLQPVAAGADAAAWAVASPALLAAANGQLLIWDGETGLDGLVFARQVAVGRVSRPWLLHGWQCKGGHHLVEITGGSLSTSVNIFVQRRNVGGVDDTTIHGIIVKAQVGMCQVMAAWHAAMEATVSVAGDRPKLLPSSLLITTTKDARLARLSLERMGAVYLSKAIATMLDVPRAWMSRYYPYGPSALTAVIDVRLHEGLSWLRDCVPDDVRMLAAEYFPADAGRVPMPPGVAQDPVRPSRRTFGCNLM